MASDNLNWLAHLPEGWHPLYRDLVVGLADLDPDIVIVQAKQKFGELRVYLGKYHLDAEALIRTAESLSQAMCELCGDIGERRISRTGWVRTLCDAHGGGFRPAGSAPSREYRLARRARSAFVLWPGGAGKTANAVPKALTSPRRG